MDSGRVSDSRTDATVRALSRSNKSCGKLGCANKRASNRTDCSRSVGEDSVRIDIPPRSALTPPPRCAATSAIASEILASDMAGSTLLSGKVALAIPRASIPLVSDARPALFAGSRRLPASKSRFTSSMGMVWFSTKYTRAPLSSTQC